MEAIFTLPYSEYESIVQTQKRMKKDSYSVFVPVSRQQKGIDFLILNLRNNKNLRVQVKSSRSYVLKEKKNHTNKQRFDYNFLFNNFSDKYHRGLADIYYLFGLYQEYKTDKKVNSKMGIWKSFILVFTDEEMGDFLSHIKTKNENKTDTRFSLGFDELNKFVLSRGKFEGTQFGDEYLLENRYMDLEKQLNSNAINSMKIVWKDS